MSAVSLAAARNSRRRAQSALAEDVGHFGDRQALGKRDRTREDVAAREPCGHLVRGRRLREAVLARLQPAIDPGQTRGQAERPRIGDDPGVG